MTTKIHATCDALGNPTHFHLTPGEAHDLEGADALLPTVLNETRVLIADKAYAAKERVLDLIEQVEGEAVIPSKANEKNSRPVDRDMYGWRHLIENFFATLKHYRAIATRYDKRAVSFLGGVHLAAIAIWLK